jgi:hypothetical protein
MSNTKNNECKGCVDKIPVDKMGVHIYPDKTTYVCMLTIDKLFCEATKRYGTTLQKLAEN